MKTRCLLFVDDREIAFEIPPEVGHFTIGMSVGDVIPVVTAYKRTEDRENIALVPIAVSSCSWVTQHPGQTFSARVLRDRYLLRYGKSDVEYEVAAVSRQGEGCLVTLHSGEGLEQTRTVLHVTREAGLRLPVGARCRIDLSAV